MPRNRRAAALSAPVISLALLAAVGMAGCASPAALKTGATRPPARAGARANVIAYSINSDGPHFQAIVSGAVGDYGSAVTIDANGKADREHGSELQLNLASGSFRLSISSLDKKFVQAASHEPIYPRTCSTYLRVTAAAPIVPGSGTGTYRGIGGSFTITATANEVHVTPCGHSLKFLRQITILAGPGTVSLTAAASR
jgi:hypothetical protein